MTAPRWPAAQQSPGSAALLQGRQLSPPVGRDSGAQGCLQHIQQLQLCEEQTPSQLGQEHGDSFTSPLLGKGSALKDTLGSSFPIRQLSKPSNTTSFLFSFFFFFPRTNSSGEVRSSRKLTESAWQIFFAQSSWCCQSVTQLTA